MTERLKIRLLEFHLAHHCNLACQGCSHFSPSAPKAPIPRESVEREFELAGRRLDPRFVHLLGGEPLLNRDAPALLPAARRAFPDASIKLVTNGLLVLRRASALLPALEASGVDLAVSVYPGIDLNEDAISDACAVAGVCLEFWRQSSFLDFIDPEGGFDPAKARASCPMDDALNVRDGRLYPCPVAAWSDFGGSPIDPEDGVPLTASADQLRAALDRGRPTSKCQFCNPSPPRRAHAMGDRLSLLRNPVKAYG